MRVALDSSSASLRKVLHMSGATDARSPGRVIRAARERAELTREELAREAQVSTSTVARLELKDRLPNALALARIAARVGVPVSALLPKSPERVSSSEPVAS
jgi:transcriptional regulator with XRE-family HTH domain